jgi:putative transcriptional regulator
MQRQGEDRIEVTDDNFGELLIQGLREVRAIQGGESEPAHRVRRVVTVQDAEVKPPRHYKGAGIQKIRERMGLSQAVFARVLNASPDTVKAWEQGKREPDGMALALLEVADTHPEALLERVTEKSARRTRG